MNNAQETRNTNVRGPPVIYFGYSAGALCSRRRSPGPTDSHERVWNIYIPLLFINILAKESILLLLFFFSRTVTVRVPTYIYLFIIQKKNERVCVYGYYYIYIYTIL